MVPPAPMARPVPTAGYPHTSSTRRKSIAAAAEKAKPYPLAKCLVSGNDLDSMGGPITKVYNGQEIKFCCKPCIKKFEANQAKYLAKLK